MTDISEVSGARASSLTEQLQRGFRWMRFAPALESAWHVDQFRDGIGYHRVSLVILAAVLLIMFKVDKGVMPEISGRMIASSISTS